jgi:hypothetical protein
MSSVESDSTKSQAQAQTGSTPKKLTPSKLKRKEERDVKFNRSNLNDSNPNLDLNDQDSSVNELVNVEVTDMSDKITCGEFQYAGDQLTIGTRWTTWNELFDLYVTAHGLTDAKKIKATYLLQMGKEAYEIYKTKKKNDDSDTLAEIKVFMSAQFVAKKSEYTEIMTFRRAFKNVDETVSDYVMRLRRLATDCNYGTTVEKEIERQFVVGCNMEEVQRKCCRTDNLDLKQALEIATGFERVNANVRNLRSPLDNSKHHSLNHIEQNRNQQNNRRSNRTDGNSSSAKKCGYCGRDTHENRSMCPARGSTCHKCGKLNHFQSVCRADAQTAALFKQNNQGSSHRSSQRHGTSPNTNQAKLAPIVEKAKKQVSQVSVGASPPSNDNNQQSISPADMDGYWRYKKLVDYGLNTFAIVKDRVVMGPRANVTMFDLKSEFLVDTGAPVNVIDEITYAKFANKAPLEKCNISFYGYSAEKPLPILGQFVTQVHYKERSATAGFIVIKGNEQNLLSFKSSKDLGIILVDSPETPIK